MSKDESTKDIVVTKNKTDSFFQVSKNCVPYRPLPRWLRQNQYPLYLPEICEPLWSERLFRGVLMTISVGSSRGDWLLAALRLGSCAAAESAAAVGRLWRDGKKGLSDSPSLQPPGDPSPVHLLTPSSASVLLPGPPVCGPTLPLPAAEMLGLALGLGARVRLALRSRLLPGARRTGGRVRFFPDAAWWRQARGCSSFAPNALAYCGDNGCGMSDKPVSKADGL